MKLQKQKYLDFIVTSLHIELSDFMQCVAAKDRCYEPLIYHWIISLFEKGVPKQQALHIIHRARMQIFLQNTIQIQSQIKAKQLEYTEQMLKNNDYYNNLTDEHKAIAIQKITTLTNQPELSKERINEVLQNMNPQLTVKTEENKLIIFKNTLLRIKKEILRIVDKPDNK